MNECTFNLFSDARALGVISPQGNADRPIMLAAMRTRTGMLKNLALGTMVSLFATVSLFGCQSAEDQALAAETAKTKSTNTSTPKSSWPKMLTIPSGSTLLVSLDTPMRTDREKTGDSFKARLVDAVRVDEMTVLPAGTEVRGRLTLVEEPHRTTGKAQMTLVFDQVVDPAGKYHAVSTSPIMLVAKGDQISDEEKVAAGAVIGGVIGALASDKQRAKGAAVGAAAGAAAGGAVALATKGGQLDLPAGQRFAVELNEPLRLSVSQLTASR